MTARPGWMAASLAVVGLAASAGRDGNALAEALHPPVVVELVQCEPALAAEVRRIVGVELRATVIDAAGAGAAVTRVSATCHGTDVHLSLTDAGTAKHLERSLATAEAAPAARPRLVALAVAELVVAGWQESESTPSKPSPPVPAPPPRAPAAEAPSPTQLRAMADALAVARVFPRSDLWLLGAGARGSFALSLPLVLTLELAAEWGETSRATGRVAARTLGGALGLGWAVARSWAFIMPWAGARTGVARLRGEPGSGSDTLGATQSGPYLGPELGVALSFFPQAPVHATVALSAGTMVLGVRGKVAGDADVAASGPWVGLGVGLGLTKP